VKRHTDPEKLANLSRYARKMARRHPECWRWWRVAIERRIQADYAMERAVELEEEMSGCFSAIGSPPGSLIPPLRSSPFLGFKFIPPKITPPLTDGRPSYPVIFVYDDAEET